MRSFCIVFVLLVDPAMALEPEAKRSTPDLRSVPTVRLANRRARHAVSSAVRAAGQRLEEPRCRRLFSEFRDRGGRTLAQNLDTLGQTPASYLGFVLFYDGTGQAPCQHRKVLAVTTVGSRVVFVCSRFADVQHRDPVFAEAVIIHETLHSLGLAHDSPSSNSITARVRESCGHPLPDPPTLGSRVLVAQDANPPRGRIPPTEPVRSSHKPR